MKRVQWHLRAWLLEKVICFLLWVLPVVRLAETRRRLLIADGLSHRRVLRADAGRKRHGERRPGARSLGPATVTTITRQQSSPRPD